MTAALAGAAAWLDAAGVGSWARGNPYPIVNVLHLLGLVMLVGGIGVLDLRVVGAWRSIPLPALSRALTPVAAAGLAVLAASGGLLFAADGKALAGSATFQLKLALIAIAIANVTLFHLLGRPGEAPGVARRVVALASIGLWLSVATAGRMIAYS